MTMDSSGLGQAQLVRCHACNTRGSGKGSCKQCGTTYSKRHPPGTILGSYKLHEVIGEGGMGIVYLATHSKLGRRVAIKMLRSHYTNNPQAIQRFFAEARAVNKIRHPNIVEITDFIEQPGDDNYYVMELLEGTNLAHVIVTNEVIPLSRSIGIMVQLASVAEAVHRAGIVHRDLKPENVFLIERNGQPDFVKLVDFGVAKLIDDSDDFVSTHNTNPGAILGTPDYMSPEQASAVPVDHRTDIYAFGAMLYELVTGKLPLKGENFGDIVVKLMTVTPTPPSELGLPQEVPAALEELIMSCLEKQTIDRPDSMETIGERLGEIAEEQGWIVYELNVRPSGPVHMRPDTKPPFRATPSGGMPPLRPRVATPAGGTPPLAGGTTPPPVRPTPGAGTPPPARSAPNASTPPATQRPPTPGGMPPEKRPTPGAGSPPADNATTDAASGTAQTMLAAADVRSPSAALADRMAAAEVRSPSTALADRIAGAEGARKERSAPSAATAKSRRTWMIAASVAAAVAIVVVAIALSRGSKADDVAVKVNAQLKIADERIAAGKLVAPGGDDALEHLLEARKLAPNNAAVAQRLHSLAQEYEQLADSAIAADSLAEAAAHLQVVLSAEPDNAAAATKMKDVEAKMLQRQRAPLNRP